MQVRPVALILAVLGSAFLAGTALAATPSTLLPAELRAALPDCACEADREALSEAQRAIAGAASIEDARDQALAKSRMARRAIRAARWMAPGSDDLARAGGRLEDYELRVAAAETPEDVAWEFGELVQLAALGSPVMADIDVDIDGDGGCDFSGGEIIAIVLGFIFGIIPGIILLVLLC